MTVIASDGFGNSWDASAVTARRLLGLTGSAGALAALPIAIFTILCGTSLVLLRRRSEA